MSFEKNGWARNVLACALFIWNVFILTLDCHFFDADHVSDLMSVLEVRRRTNLQLSQMLKVCLFFRFVFIHVQVFY